jgi:hypothetical protein
MLPPEKSKDAPHFTALDERRLNFWAVIATIQAMCAT